MNSQVETVTKNKTRAPTNILISTVSTKAAEVAETSTNRQIKQFG